MPWRFFDVEVSKLTRLSPTFLRVTLTGADLDRFADLGFDARIKVVLPVGARGYDNLPRGEEWYPRWRALPKQTRNPLRSYTTRNVRPERREVDIDFVTHDDGGPASTWATRAEIGQPLVVLGPDVGFTGHHGGVEFTPPAPGEGLILAGDETAAPAIMTILSQLPADTQGHAIVEVPDEADRPAAESPEDMQVSWLVRGSGSHGDLLVPAVRQGGRVADTHSVWLAGERGVVRDMRRAMLKERGMGKRQITFMGYWRHGRASG